MNAWLVNSCTKWKICVYTYDQCKLSCDNIGLHKYVSYSVISDFTVSLGIYHYLIVETN